MKQATDRAAVTGVHQRDAGKLCFRLTQLTTRNRQG